MTAAEIQLLETGAEALVKALLALYESYQATKTAAGQTPMSLHEIADLALKESEILPDSSSAADAVADNALDDRFPKGTP